MVMCSTSFVVVRMHAHSQAPRFQSINERRGARAGHREQTDGYIVEACGVKTTQKKHVLTCHLRQQYNSRVFSRGAPGRWCSIFGGRLLRVIISPTTVTTTTATMTTEATTSCWMCGLPCCEWPGGVPTLSGGKLPRAFSLFRRQSQQIFGCFLGELNESKAARPSLARAQRNMGDGSCPNERFRECRNVNTGFPVGLVQGRTLWNFFFSTAWVITHGALTNITRPRYRCRI